MALTRALALVALVSSATACLEPEPGEIITDDEAAEALDETDSALVSSGSWQASNQTSVDLGSASDRFCYFTDLRGNFRGTGEHIQLAVQNNRWVLSGRSAQAELRAEAQCTAFSEFATFGADRQVSIPAGWSVSHRTGTRYRTMWGSGNSLCWLSALGGALNGGSNGVGVSRDASTWNVDAWAYVDAPQPVEGAGMCAYLGAGRGYFPAGSTTGFHYWRQGEPYVRMAPAATSVCWLTAAHGAFHGYGEAVSVRKLSDGYYYLMGISGSSGNAVSASAFCVSRQLTSVFSL